MTYDPHAEKTTRESKKRPARSPSKKGKKGKARESVSTERDPGSDTPDDIDADARTSKKGKKAKAKLYKELEKALSNAQKGGNPLAPLKWPVLGSWIDPAALVIPAGRLNGDGLVSLCKHLRGYTVAHVPEHMAPHRSGYTRTDSPGFATTLAKEIQEELVTDPAVYQCSRITPDVVKFLIVLDCVRGLDNRAGRGGLRCDIRRRGCGLHYRHCKDPRVLP
jgi:hypothetical protein